MDFQATKGRLFLGPLQARGRFPPSTSLSPFGEQIPLWTLMQLPFLSVNIYNSGKNPGRLVMHSEVCSAQPQTALY